MGLVSISYPVKPQKFSFNSMGRIGDFTFYSAIAAYQEFFQDEATILYEIPIWDGTNCQCTAKKFDGGGEYVDIFHSFLL